MAVRLSYTRILWSAVWTAQAGRGTADLRTQKSRGEDSGTSQRWLGVLLTCLKKREGVFVFATSNDVTRLPPELLRKGRFDAIFLVAVPDPATRERLASRG